MPGWAWKEEYLHLLLWVSDLFASWVKRRLFFVLIPFFDFIRWITCERSSLVSSFSIKLILF